MYNFNDEEPKEELVIPIYNDKDLNCLEKDNGDECHYKTEFHVFNFSELLAIASKGSYKGHHLSRGGALVFVRDREEPFISRDDYSVKKIIDNLEKNPLACLSGLNKAGSSNIYCNCDYKIKNDILILPNGAHLFLTKEARKTIEYIYDIMNNGPKKTCFFETRKKIRERNRIQLIRKKM